MAVLVTRPQPDDETTAAALRARGFEVLQAPMLRFEAVAFHDDDDARYGAVIVTSANALRGIAPHLASSRLAELPTNHSPQFAPVLDPTVRAGITAMLTAAGAWLR